MHLNDMTSADIDRAAERYYDRMLDRYQQEDAWDHYDPDWKAVYDIVSGRDEEEIADLVREHIEGDGDLMDEILLSGAVDDYIHPEETWMLKDSDDVGKLADRLFDREWENDALMMRLWEDEKIYKPICEKLKDDADVGRADGIREEYNDIQIEKAEAWREWNEEHRGCE